MRLARERPHATSVLGKRITDACEIPRNLVTLSAQLIVSAHAYGLNLEGQSRREGQSKHRQP